jgi:UDP-glucose 4-epimerase
MKTSHAVTASSASEIFISGGAGFIGSHFTRRILKFKSLQKLTIFDNFSSGTNSHLSEVDHDPRLNIVRADLKDKDAIIKAMKGAQVVIHLAANPDIAKAVTQPDIDFWEGTYLAQNVLEAIRINGVGRLLYTSGSGVYGEDANVSFKENYGPCIPISTYGASKLACEALISAYVHMFGLTARAFRFANVVGPRQTHGVGYDFVRRLTSDPTQLRILGDGSQSKSYIHVDDIMNAVLLADEKCSKPYDVFNVATGDYITVKEIADIAKDVCLAPNMKYLFTGGDRGWKGDVPIVRFDSSKIESLGWKCERNSAQAIRDSLISMRKELVSA